MDEVPFPQYKKGIPKAGLDDITQFIMAIGIAGLPFFFVQMALGDWFLAPVVSGVVAFCTFRYVAVPTVRHVYNRLPPLYLEHTVSTTFFRGGLVARPDPDPLPFKVK